LKGSAQQRWETFLKSALLAILLFPAATQADQFRVAVGMIESDVKAGIEKIGGVDITSKHIFVGPEVRWPVRGSFWALLDYDAVIEASFIEGKVAALTFWSRNHFSRNANYRDDLRQPAVSLAFDTNTKTVTIETSGFQGPKRYFLPVLDEKVNPLLFPTEARYDEPDVIYAPDVVYPFEMRVTAGIAGEVKLFIKVQDGRATRIAIAGASQEIFARYAVINAMQTLWKTDSNIQKPRDGWFSRTIIFVRKD
jgi:hypothetical protein